MCDDHRNTPHSHLISGIRPARTTFAQKAEKVTPPPWFRDSTQLRALIQGAWDEVSAEFTDKLLKLIGDGDYDAVEKLLSANEGLGGEAAQLLAKGPEAVLLNMHLKADSWWKLHGEEAGVKKTVGLTEKYQRLMAKAQANQVLSFVEKFPERVLHPEIIRQLQYLQDTARPDALTISGIADRLERFSKADDYWGKITDTHVARAWVGDGIRYAKENGIAVGRVTGPMDNKTCPVCRHMIGLPISIDKAIAKLDRDLGITDPEKYVEAWKFPRIEDVDNMSREKLRGLAEENGWYGAFHPHCRHYVAWLYAAEMREAA